MTEPHYTQQDMRAAERERILWAALGVSSHTAAHQRIAQLISERDTAQFNLDACASDCLKQKLLIASLEQQIADLSVARFIGT